VRRGGIRFSLNEFLECRGMSANIWLRIPCEHWRASFRYLLALQGMEMRKCSKVNKVCIVVGLYDRVQIKPDSLSHQCILCESKFMDNNIQLKTRC
jgi:hypothetical protein